MTKIAQATTGLPYKCTHPDCNKSFSNQGLLTRHMRIHTGEKPFACEICGKQFSQRGNLSKHLLSHENAHLRWNRETNFKPFKCPYPGCGKSFTAKLNLQNHVATHHSHEQLATECLPVGTANGIALNTNVKSNMSATSSSATAAASAAPTRSSSRTMAMNKLDYTSVNNSSTSTTTPAPNTTTTSNTTFTSTNVAQQCLHSGCEQRFTSEVELREHLFRTTPGIIEEFNFLREMALQFAGVVCGYETLTHQEQASMRLFARSAVRAVQSIPAATTSTSNGSNNSNNGGNSKNVISETGSTGGSVCPATVYNNYIQSVGMKHYNSSSGSGVAVEPIAVTCGNADCSCAQEYSHHTNTNTSSNNSTNTATNTHTNVTTHLPHTAHTTSYDSEVEVEVEEDGWSDLGSIIDDLTSPHHHTTDCVDGGCAPYAMHYATNNNASGGINVYSGNAYQHCNYTHTPYHHTITTTTNTTNNTTTTNATNNTTTSNHSNPTPPSAYAVDDSVLYSPLLFAHDRIAAGWEQHTVFNTNNTINTSPAGINNTSTSATINTVEIAPTDDVVSREGKNTSAKLIGIAAVSPTARTPEVSDSASATGSATSGGNSSGAKEEDAKRILSPTPTSTYYNKDSTTTTPAISNNTITNATTPNTTTPNTNTNTTAPPTTYTYSCCAGHRRRSFDITSGAGTAVISNNDSNASSGGSSVKKQRV